MNIIKDIGEPIACGEVIFYKGVSLFEYQNTLYDLFEDLGGQDTITVTECRWKKGNRDLVVWWKTTDNSELSIDCLEWADTIEW